MNSILSISFFIVSQIIGISKMKSTVVLMVLGSTFLFIGNSVNAWGGIYNNRFSPEMLQNMGYGAPHRIYQEVGLKSIFVSCNSSNTACGLYNNVHARIRLFAYGKPLGPVHISIVHSFHLQLYGLCTLRNFI